MNVWEPKRCCCGCFDLRNGTLILGILYLVFAVLSEVRFLVHVFVNVVAVDDQNARCIYGICSGDDYTIMYSVVIVSLILNGGYIGILSLLIHGVQTERPGYFMPYIILKLIGLVCFVILMVVGIMLIFVYAEASGLAWELSLAVLVGGGLMMTLSIYFLSVINGHRLELVRKLSGLERLKDYEEPMDEKIQV